MHRGYPHIAEQLVVDVAVQLLYQLRAAQACVHLQDHQRNLALRREVQSASGLRSHNLSRQSKVLRHLMQGKFLPDPSKLALFERFPVQIIKSNYVNGRLGDIATKFSTLAMQINFCDTSKFGFTRAAGGGILFIFCQDTNFLLHCK